MAQTTTIPDNWQETLETKIDAMHKARDSSTSEEHKEQAARDLVAHVMTQFGSDENYQLYLYADLRRLARDKGLSTDAIDSIQSTGFTISDQSSQETAHDIAAFYETIYLEVREGIDYNAAYLHPDADRSPPAALPTKFDFH